MVVKVQIPVQAIDPEQNVTTAMASISVEANNALAAIEAVTDTIAHCLRHQHSVHVVDSSVEPY